MPGTDRRGGIFKTYPIVAQNTVGCFCE